MPPSSSWAFPLALLFILVVCLPDNQVLAFGAGNIPSFAYLEGKAFRHGDIEDTLAELSKKAGGFALGALIGKGGSKFGGLDIKRVYFGNWLRDYSQAVDIAGLQKLPLQTILNLCMVLGFLAHGYATEEFEVTKERLGVYLPTEHIDNPKGYGDGQDPRQFDPRLRGPIDPRELEVDPNTGMKNYIANENGNWDTSKALVRRTLEQCIHVGRTWRSTGRKEDQYEAFRLLGQALHTLEDFPAHSNFTELALVSLGHSHVFVHVGDRARVRAPNGSMVAPIVTGTFGGSDFIHSLLGEATDHISQASVSDLNQAVDSAKARSQSTRGGAGPVDTLRDLLFKLPGGSNRDSLSRDMTECERLRDAPSHGGKNPETMTPQELHSVLWQVLSFRDRVVKSIEVGIERIPGLGSLIEKLQDSIAVFIYTTLEPYLKPLLKTASSQLMTASEQVINSHDQYEVFNDPLASDPTHSFLSKDHFALILNEPAGNLAKIIVKHAVSAVVKCWDDTSVNPRPMVDEVLQCLFHPDFHDRNSSIQREMMQYVASWSQSAGPTTLRRLTKEAVRNHDNIRLQGQGGAAPSQGTYAMNAGVNANSKISGYVQGIPAVQQAQGLYNKIQSFGVGGQGGMRDGPTPDGSFAPPSGPPPGASSYGSPPPSASSYGSPPPPPHSSRPSGGQAAGYYGGGGGGGGPESSFMPLSGPPPGTSSPYPTSPPPTFPGAAPPYGSTSSYPGQDHHQHQHHQSAYPGQSQSSYPGQSTYPGQQGGGGGYGGGFPSTEPSGYPGQSTYGGSTYPGQMPGSVPSFPGAEPSGGFAPPPGPPGMPGMPGMSMPGHEHEHHGHHQHHQHHQSGYNPGY